MKKIVYIITAILLLSHGLYAQVEQIRSGTSQGAKWTSGGVYTNFGVAGQYSIASQVGGGNYSGNIGFMFYADAQSAANEAPIAFDNQTNFYHELADQIELMGIDPEGDSIEFVINTSPVNLNAVQSGIKGEFVNFSPKNVLKPDSVYNDSIKFIVREIATGVESDIATVLFQFKLEDTPHYVVALDRVNSDFTVQFVDTIKNSGYTLDINYYDLSDINNPVFVPIIQSELLIGDFAVSNDTLSYTFSVDENVHNHLFNASQVFTTALVTSNNGYSDFAAYMIDNSSGSGKTSGSEDGQFWVIGSEQTVPENKTVMLNMMAVEFTDADMSNATIDILSDATKGEIGTVIQTETQANLITWEVPYTSTQDVGGLDSLLFRVYHPGRNLFDSTYVQVEIIDVNDPPSINELLDRQISEDEVLTLDVNYFDPDNELEITVSSNEATSITVSESNGLITVVPDLNFFGLTTITVIAKELNTDEEFVVIESFDLDIIPSNDSPVVAPVANQQVDEDNTVNVVLSATDPDSDFQLFDYFAQSDDPSIAQVEIVDNLLIITPKPNLNGVVNISVKADDRTGSANSLSSELTFDVEFNAINDAPQIIEMLSAQVLVQDFPAYNIELSTNFLDVETEAAFLQYSVANNTNIAINFAGSVATITTSLGFFGSENITFTVSDGLASVDMLVSFVVQEKSSDVNVANPLSAVSLNEDFGTHEINLATVFEDINNSSAVFTYDIAGNSTLSYVIDDANNTIIFTSVEDFNGNEELILIGTTNGKSSFTTIELTINPVNDAPVMNEIPNQTIFEDGSIAALLLNVSDIDNDPMDLTISAISSNQSIIIDDNLVLTQTNGFYYLNATPNINQHGTVDITLVASDGMLTNQQTFTLTINTVNDSPVIIGNLYMEATEKEFFSLEVTNLFEDADGDPLSFSIENLPSWLSFNGTTLSGTPANDDVDFFEIQITSNDSFSETVALFTLQVNNVNDAPILQNQLPDITIQQENAFSYLFPTFLFKDVDKDDELTYSVEKFPKWAVLSNNDVSGVPQHEHIGIDTLVFKAVDPAGLFVTDTVVVTVKFTVYDAVVSLSGSTICLGEKATVIATGAINYNWYDVSGNLLQSGGDKYENSAENTFEVFVEGVDTEGRATLEKVSTIITVNPLPDVAITQTEESISVPNDASATYQWYNGADLIVEADQNDYNPLQTGDYSVEVTSALGCTLISETVSFIITGLELDNYTLNIFPNPTYNYLVVSGAGNLAELTFDIIDMNGKLLNVQLTANAREVKINTGLLNDGEYILRIKSDNSVESIRFTKK